MTVVPHLDVLDMLVNSRVGTNTILVHLVDQICLRQITRWLGLTLRNGQLGLERLTFSEFG